MSLLVPQHAPLSFATLDLQAPALTRSDSMGVRHSSARALLPPVVAAHFYDCKTDYQCMGKPGARQQQRQSQIPSVGSAFLSLVATSCLRVSACRRKLVGRRNQVQLRAWRQTLLREKEDECKEHVKSSFAEQSQDWRSQLPKLSPTNVQHLRNGGVVQAQERCGPTGSGFVVVEVEAPQSLILNQLAAFDEYPNMIPVIRDVDVQTQVRQAEYGLFAKVSYKVSRFWLGVSVMHVVDTAAGLVRFNLDPSNQGGVFQEASGFWHVESVPGTNGSRSRVWLCASLRASSLLPHWLLDYAAKRALRRATAWLKPFMEKLWLKEQPLQILRAQLQKQLQVA